MAPKKPVPETTTVRDLTLAEILSWCDATGRWPRKTSGRIAGTVCETWDGVDWALRAGRRGLPGGSSLARLLAEHRGVRNEKALPPLTVPAIKTWIVAHYRRAGRWPTRASGPVVEAPGETWKAVEAALRRGGRGLSGN